MIKNNQIDNRDMSLQTIVVKKCIVCDSIFKVKRKEIWAGRGKYCSRKCAHIGRGILMSLNSQKNRIEKQCKVCGDYIYVKKSYEHTKGIYCSKECMANDYKEILKKEKNPNFRHGLSHTAEYSKEHYHKRRNIQNISGNTLSRKEIKIILSSTSICYWCNKKIKGTKSLDHYYPLSKGGDNSIGNIVVSCILCNLRKNAKDPHDFAMSLGRLL